MGRGRRTARVAGSGRTRTLDGSDAPVVPSEGPPPELEESASPAAAPESPATVRPPIDLEASRRRLEERQQNWVAFREAWAEKRRRKVANPEGPAEPPSGDPPA